MEGHDPFVFAQIIAGGMTLFFMGFIIIILFATCKQIRDSNMRPAEKTETQDTLHVAHYIRPELPSLITEPQERASYYVRHYWDHYSLADTAFIHSNQTEQLFADFLDALQYTDSNVCTNALQNMMTYMEANETAYGHFCFLSEKYLYDPNSPMRNEDYYIVVLEQMIASPRLTEYDKIRPADQLQQARKNRPGMTATDFTYITPTGEVSKMSRLKAEFTLLFFYDPDCTNCKENERILSEVPLVLNLQKEGRLRILAVYPDDNKKEWLLNASKMPEGWIIGWNKQGDIRSQQLYDIRATPTLYMLDKQKKVIVKDAPLEKIIQHLSVATANSDSKITN